mmetsp:Transcript_39779/g.85767  ORF Transcript_39779/g.85767 Transcript_39779/m.85767 type:complete len:246 (-) Transcript_39779:265-1002(-)
MLRIVKLLGPSPFVYLARPPMTRTASHTSSLLRSWKVFRTSHHPPYPSPTSGSSTRLCGMGHPSRHCYGTSAAQGIRSSPLRRWGEKSLGASPRRPGERIRVLLALRVVTSMAISWRRRSSGRCVGHEPRRTHRSRCWTRPSSRVSWMCIIGLGTITARYSIALRMYSRWAEEVHSGTDMTTGTMMAQKMQKKSVNCIRKPLPMGLVDLDLPLNRISRGERLLRVRRSETLPCQHFTLTEVHLRS